MLSVTKSLPPYAVLVLILLAFDALGQANGFPPEKRMQSRQGYPGQADVVAHRLISKGTHLMCMQVESHPKQEDDGAACLVKFKDGSNRTLKFHDTIELKNSSEVSLECLGDKPTKCTVGLF